MVLRLIYQPLLPLYSHHANDHETVLGAGYVVIISWDEQKQTKFPGNEVWGPWQGWWPIAMFRQAFIDGLHLVGQMESQDYSKKAFQWAKALRLLDPSIKLISCGGLLEQFTLI
jgi:hypothetical protein